MSLIEQLRARGFDVKVWDFTRSGCPPMLQMTDTTGITFYMDANSTIDQCLARYEQKLSDFAVKQ